MIASLVGFLFSSTRPPVSVKIGLIWKNGAAIETASTEPLPRNLGSTTRLKLHGPCLPQRCKSKTGAWFTWYLLLRTVVASGQQMDVRETLGLSVPFLTPLPHTYILPTKSRDHLCSPLVKLVGRRLPVGKDNIHGKKTHNTEDSRVINPPADLARQLHLNSTSTAPKKVKNIQHQGFAGRHRPNY